MLTAKTGARDMVEGINAGARAYITKPFKSEELLGKVRKALGQPAK
jgi:DNA-binding response OmpR family regulator